MRYLCLLFLLFTCSSRAQVPVVLISIDGFAHHYLEKFQPKNLKALASTGVQAGGMLPVFPSKTFPNHISIVTGVYPANHGIIHNKFYHRKLKQNYKLGAGMYDSTWLTAEPIWTKAEKAGMNTAVYFWPESQAKVDGVLPSKVLTYKHNTANEIRINKVFEWLTIEGEERPNFIATYFSIVDETGHMYGRNSLEVKQSIKRIDDLIGKFKTKLEQADIKVNLIIVSDHGMTEATERHTIEWKPLVSEFNNINVVNGQTQLYIYENNTDTLSLLKESIAAKASNNNYEVFLASEYPEHWHFNGNNDVVPDLIVNALPPYTFIDETSHVGKATHGYDPTSTDDLLALFIANGPNITVGKLIDKFENIHVYSLIEHLLGLPESKNRDANKAQLIGVIAK